MIVLFLYIYNKTMTSTNNENDSNGPTICISPTLTPISKKTNGTLKNNNLLSIKTNDKDANDSSSDHEN
jgi:hypothetical protein